MRSQDTPSSEEIGTWDTHAIGAQVPKTQDAAPISHHNDLHIVAGPVAHDLIKAALVPEG